MRWAAGCDRMAAGCGLSIAPAWLPCEFAACMAAFCFALWSAIRLQERKDDAVCRPFCVRCDDLLGGLQSLIPAGQSEDASVQLHNKGNDQLCNILLCDTLRRGVAGLLRCAGIWIVHGVASLSLPLWLGWRAARYVSNSAMSSGLCRKRLWNPRNAQPIRSATSGGISFTLT